MLTPFSLLSRFDYLMLICRYVIADYRMRRARCASMRADARFAITLITLLTLRRCSTRILF